MTIRTHPIYDPPSQLSQGLVAGLSVAVVMMAGWFVVTVSQSATTPVKEGDAGARPQTPGTPAARVAASGAEDGARRRASVHFDWPEFSSPQPPSSPPLMALPPAAEIAPGGEIAPATWPPATAAPDSRDRGAASSAAVGQTGLTAGVPSRATAGRDAAAAAPPPRQTPRKQKTRADGDAGQ
jgi:hypothetical protein